MGILVWFLLGLILFNVINLVLAMMSGSKEYPDEQDGFHIANGCMFIISLLAIWVVGVIIFFKYMI